MSCPESGLAKKLRTDLCCERFVKMLVMPVISSHNPQTGNCLCELSFANVHSGGHYTAATEPEGQTVVSIVNHKGGGARVVCL